MFRTEEFSGEVVSSEEGEMHWICKTELPYRNTVDDLDELLQVILDDNLNEFQYVIKEEKWKVILK